MASTQQRQIVARLRRQTQQVQQAWQQIQNTPGRVPDRLSKVGVFNVVLEADHLGNATRLRRHKIPVEFGDHWLYWSSPSLGTEYLAFQREHYTQTRIVLEQDSINLTYHAFERLWQRTGRGIPVTEYKMNLGLGNIDPWLRLWLGAVDSPLANPGEQAWRSDIPLPYRGGLLLGDVRLGEGNLVMDTQGIQFHHRCLKFCANTFVSEDLLTDSQRQIYTAVVQRDWDTAQALVARQTWVIQCQDLVTAHQTYQQEIDELAQSLDRSVERI
jgi:hypothetical protein